MIHRLFVVALLLLAAAPDGADAASRLRMGLTPLADALPLYAALDQGYFAAEGLDLEITPLFGGSRIIEAVAGGSLDMGASATLMILQAAEQGLDLVITNPSAFVRTDGRSTNALMVLESSGITSGAQLKGKVIGVGAVKSLSYLLAAEFLATNGVKADQVIWQEVPFSQMPQALETGRVQAVAAVEPFLTVLKASGKARLIAGIDPPLAGSSLAAYVSLRSWYQANVKTVEAFVRAYGKGVEFCDRNPRQARELLVKHVKMSQELAQDVTLALFRPGLKAADVAILQELARRHGVLEKGVQIDRILAPTVPSQ